MVHSTLEQELGTEGTSTLKPPALPSRLVSTVPGFGWLHMLQVLRLAQFVLPQPLHVQSPSANMPVSHQSPIKPR